MKAQDLIGVALASGALLFSVAAFADGYDDDARLGQSAKVSMVEAIKLAEDHVSGRAFQVDIDDDRFETAYEIELEVQGHVKEVWVSVKELKVLEVKSDDDDDDIPKARKVGLAKLVETAQAHKGGKAFEAECDDDRWDTTCEVSVVTSKNEVWDIVLDGESGKVISSRIDKDDD